MELEELEDFGLKGLAIIYLDRIDDTNKESLINLLNN